jgi:hypothetical protein
MFSFSTRPGRARTMPMIGSIESQHRGLLRALELLEGLAEVCRTRDELAHAVEELRRALLAHELTAERFILTPLRRLRRLDADAATALRAELDDLAADALRLATGDPDAGAVTDFAAATRKHIERQAELVVPVARDALAHGELPSVPAWCVDEAFWLRGGPAESWPEQWLG